MAASAVFPRARPATVGLNPAARRARAAARRTVQLALLIPAGLFLLLFTADELLLHGWQIGGVSAELRAHHQLEIAVNLSAAALVGAAWLAAIRGRGGWLRLRLWVCAGAVVACLAGGMYFEELLRHSPAMLDPAGGHLQGRFEPGGVYWPSLTAAALACTLALAAAPGMLRKDQHT